MLNKAILALSADAKPGTGSVQARAWLTRIHHLRALFAVSHPWLTGTAELFSGSLRTGPDIAKSPQL
jgi:hypothetical protein